MAITIPYPNFQNGQTIVAAQHNSNNAEIASFVDALQAGTNFNAGAIGTTSINDLAVTNGKIAGQAVTLDKLATAIANALVPTGSVIAFAGNTSSVPAGWLLCDGSAFSSTTYPNLYSLLGNTAFTPNLQDRVPLGAGTVGVRTTGGTRKIQLNDLPAHSHTNTASWSGSASVSISDPGHGHSATAGNTNLDHRHSAQAKQGTASMAHNGTTTYAAGGSPNTGEVYPSTSFAESVVVGSMDHAHSITVNGNTTGITATSSVSGTVTMNNVNNVTTHQDYYQPYYAVTYIIKAA
jgi:microcystin-dependent protein